MKKGLCLVLSAAMLLLTFAACTKKDKNNEDITTQTNANGEVYVDVTDKDGNAVTDADGNNVTSVLSEEEKSSIAENTTAQKANGTTATTKKGATTSAGTAQTDPFDVTAAKEDLLDKGTTIKKTTLREDVIVKTMKSGKFTINANMISNGEKMPVSISMDGKSLCFKMVYGTLEARALLKDGKTYIVIPSLKMYTEAEGSSVGGLGDISSVQDSQTFVGSSKVKDGSKTLTCEEYKTEEGTVIKYYFDGKTWARLEMESGDQITVLEITSFKDTVDSSLFSLDGYNKQDLSALGATTKKAS